MSQMPKTSHYEKRRQYNIKITTYNYKMLINVLGQQSINLKYKVTLNRLC